MFVTVLPKPKRPEAAGPRGLWLLYKESDPLLPSALFPSELSPSAGAAVACLPFASKDVKLTSRFAELLSGGARLDCSLVSAWLPPDQPEGASCCSAPQVVRMAGQDHKTPAAVHLLRARLSSAQGALSPVPFLPHPANPEVVPQSFLRSNEVFLAGPQ